MSTSQPTTAGLCGCGHTRSDHGRFYASKYGATRSENCTKRGCGCQGYRPEATEAAPGANYRRTSTERANTLVHEGPGSASWCGVDDIDDRADDDFSACVSAAREASEAGVEISDGAARTIGSLYAEGRASQSFASTGAILPGLWRDLFGSLYEGMPPEEQLLADMLGTYLIARESDGAVDGWSGLWVR